MIIEKNTKLVTEISLILEEYVSQLLEPLTNYLALFDNKRISRD